MDSGKRSVKAPARLTYDAMGEPTETRDAGVSGGSRAVPNGPPPAVASTSAQVPSVTRSCRSRSSISVASSRLRDLELDSEEEAMKLKHKYEEEIEEIDDEIELLEFNLIDAAQTEETEQLKKRLSALQLQKKQKSKKLRSAEKRLEETLNLAKKRVEAENEDDQRLADVDLIDLEENEKESPDKATSVWALKASQRPADQVLQGIIPEKLQEEMQFLDNVRSWGLGEREPHAQTGPKSAMKKVGLGLPGSDLEDVNRWSTPAGSTTPPTILRDNKANENQNKPDHGIMNLASALKEVLKEVKGEKEWEPKDLPTFSGKPEDWPIFKNEFRRTTPAGKVNSSQNAIRLRKALKGSAKEAVAGMLHEPENVHKILEILEATFGRSDLIIEALIRKAELVKPPDTSKPENFVNFGRVVQQLVSTAKSMKEERYLNDVGLLNKLVEKLPMTFCREWLSWIGARARLPHNLDSFGDWIDSQMLIMVRIAKPNVREDEDSSSSTGRTRPNRGSGVIAATSSDDKNHEPCVFCEKPNHPVAACYKFKRLTLEEKVKVVKEKGLCFRCLSQGHIIRECSTTSTCNVGDCRKAHHPLLHGDKSWKNIHGTAQVGSEDKTESEGETSDSSTTAALKTMAATIRQSKPLSVVRVRVKGPKGIRKIYAGLDSQSDATVIEDEVCDAIGVTGAYFHHICTGVNGIVMKGKARHLADFQIGGSYPQAQWYDVKGAKTMSKLGLPRYNQNAEKAQENWPHLRKAKLETFSNVKIQMLIGEDHPFLTAHRNILEKGQHDPMAKRTVLGWVLAGKRLATTDSSSIRAIRSNEELDTRIKETNAMDCYGMIPAFKADSVVDKQALELLNQKSTKENENYNVKKDTSVAARLTTGQSCNKSEDHVEPCLKRNDSDDVSFKIMFPDDLCSTVSTISSAFAELDDDGNEDEGDREPGEMNNVPLPAKTEIEELIPPGAPLTEDDIDDHFLNRFSSNADGEGKEGDEAHVEGLDNSEVDKQDNIIPSGRPVRRKNRRLRDSEEDLEDMGWNQKPKKKKFLPPGTARRGGRRRHMSRQEKAALSRRQKRALMSPEEKEKLREIWKEEARIMREKERNRRSEGKSFQALVRNDDNENVENGRNKGLTRKAKFKALIKEEPASSYEKDFDDMDDQAVQNDLQKGFIPTVFPGADGQIRLFEVTTVDRNTNRKKTLRWSGQGYSTGTSHGKIGVIPPILRVGM